MFSLCSKVAIGALFLVVADASRLTFLRENVVASDLSCVCILIQYEIELSKIFSFPAVMPVFSSTCEAASGCSGA